MKNGLLIAGACLLSLLSTIGASLAYPLLPPLFAGAENALNAWAGLAPKLLFGIALMVNPVGMLLGSAVLGSWSDVLGRRRILLLTTAGAAAGHLLTAYALLRSPIRCWWRRASSPASWKAMAPSCAPCWPSAWTDRCAATRCPG